MATQWNDGTKKVLTQSTQFASSTRGARGKELRSRHALVSVAYTSEKARARDQCARQFTHSLNGKDGIDSLCLRCGVLVASVDDEWCLLDHERRHVCSRVIE